MSRVEPPDLPAGVIARAFDGDAHAFGAFFERYDPTVRWAVGLRVYRWSELVPELEDVVQDVWWELTKNACKRLRYHDPARGVPLWRFVSIIAMRLAWRLVKRRLGHPEIEPTDVLDDEEGLESKLIDAELVERLRAMAKARLEHVDWALFEGYFVRGEQLKDVGARLGMTENATYQRKKRLEGKLHKLAQALLGQGPTQSSKELVAVVLAALVATSPDGASWVGHPSGSVPRPMEVVHA